MWLPSHNDLLSVTSYGIGSGEHLHACTRDIRTTEVRTTSIIAYAAILFVAASVIYVVSSNVHCLMLFQVPKAAASEAPTPVRRSTASDSRWLVPGKNENACK